MSTRGGCNSLFNSSTGEEIKIVTGCKNSPTRDSLFCNDCIKLTVKNESVLKFINDNESKDGNDKSKLVAEKLLLIEEVHRNFRNDRKEVLVKFFGIINLK